MGAPYNLYMATTADELELPLCVGKAKEVAQYLGVPLSYIYQAVCRQKSGTIRGYRVFRIKEAEDGEKDP